jgi:nifR3 family TIM-barrel protein
MKKIKDILGDHRICMAPIASITDVAFRKFIDEMGGIGLMFTELVSAEAIRRKNVKTLDMLKKINLKTPEFVQLFGHDPLAILDAAKYIYNETPFQGIDINMGCPVRKVIQKGSGSALLKDHKKISTIISLLKKYIQLPITAKIRLGFDSVNVLKTVKILENEGIDAITVHFRLKKDQYNQPARWEYAQELREHIKSHFIGNGDITTPEDIDEKLKLVDTVMIGRAAIRNPLIFYTYRTGHTPKTQLEKIRIMQRFLEILEEFFDERTCLQKFKSFIKFFISNQKYSRALRKSLFSIQSYQELKTILHTNLF